MHASILAMSFLLMHESNIKYAVTSYPFLMRDEVKVCFQCCGLHSIDGGHLPIFSRLFSLILFPPMSFLISPLLIPLYHLPLLCPVMRNLPHLRVFMPIITFVTSLFFAMLWSGPTVFSFLFGMRPFTCGLLKMFLILIRFKIYKFWCLYKLLIDCYRSMWYLYSNCE